MASNKIVTPEFKLHHIRQFIESITEPANTIYYVFAGKPTQYLLGDNTIDTPNTDIESLTTRVYDEMILAKKVTSNDVKPLVSRYDWTTGTVYDMYDSLDKNLKDKAFFVVSKEGGTYYVFKCLYNKEGIASTSQPIFSATSADDVYYETADGYIWKYMYQIDQTTFNKFSTIDYIPVIPDANVSANAISGEIDVIKIVSGGKDYNNHLEGSFTASDVRYNGSAIQYRITSANAASNTDFYEGCILKIVSGDGIGQYRKIVSYDQVSGYYVVTIDEPFLVTPTTSNFEISPEVIITGDGRQTINAEARALINATAANTIYKIEILNKGKDYFLATANAYANPVAKLSNSINQAELRVIYSPKGGHGYDAESELFATNMGISVKFSNSENGEISTDNDFRTVGLLKDPKFNDVKLTYDSLSGVGFSDGEELIQAKLNKINGTVGVDSSSKNIFSICTLTAIQVVSSGNITFSNTDIVTVSNVVINATATVVSNSTGYLSSLPLSSAGYGISDTSSAVITSANATGGNVRHFNSKIITGLSASANGLSYNNNDIIQISSTSAIVNAIAILSTNATGGISNITITNSGKGFASNEIAYLTIVNAGRGYNSTVNNQIAFTGGGGTGAVATFVNNATGNIVSISLTNRGIGYTSAPTVTPYGSPTVSAVITPVLQANGLSVKIANASGGYSNGAKVISVIKNANGDISLYSNSDIMTIVSPSSVNGNAVANIATNVDGSLNFANVNAGNNFGFNIGNTNLNYFVSNSTGGFVRRFDSKIVSAATISNSAPSYRIKNIIVTATGSGYDSTKVLRVDIENGGIGYNSTANNILVFSGSGSGANATFSNDSTGKIISVTMVANGTGYANLIVFAGNTSNVSSADDFITITPGPLANGQAVQYFSAPSQPTIGGLTNNQVYYIVGANSTGIKLANTLNGAAINITATTQDTSQYLRSVTTISINAQANGIGANLIPVLANSLVITSSDGGYGATAFFVNTAGGLLNFAVLANSGFGYTQEPTVSILDTAGSSGAFRVELEGVAENFANNDQIIFYGGTANGTANVIANGQISNIFNMYYTGRSRFLQTQEPIPTGIFFKPDGTRFFIIGSGVAGRKIQQYDLSTAWDVTTSTHAGNTATGALFHTNPNDLYITANGTSIYVPTANTTGAANGILQFSLSQAWNVQTMSYVANVTTFARETAPTGLWFKPDGTRAYLVGTTADRIQQYDLSTPWSISTATYNANVNPNISGGPANPAYQSVSLNSSGDVIYIVESGRSILYSFNLTEAWNVQSIVTSSYANLNFERVETGPTAVYLNHSLGKLWMTGSVSSDAISEYDATPVYTTNLTDSGKGFTTANLKILVANSSGGNTRYLNGVIIQDIVVANSVYDGFAVNTDVVYVTNGNINAIGNAITNATGGMTGVTLNVSGYGFVNTSSLNMYVVNSTGGDVRYFNTNVVSSIGISDGGTGYSNTDYILISSPGGSAARANLETTVTGTIVSTQLTNRGRGIIPWYVSEIEIISGGSGYSNADTIDFCGGGGTGANAILLTNSTGGIVRAFVLNGGENYECAPGVEVANSIGGTANGTNANLVAKVAKTTTLRVYNANGNPSIGQFADLTLNVKASPTLVANLIYAPTIGNTTEIVTLSTPASIEIQVADSSNLFFTTTQSSNLNLILSDNRTTFDSSISAGDKIYVETTSESQILTVDEVSNSTWLSVTEFPSFTNTAAAISVAKINAKGNIKERGADYVQVTNATGLFVTSNDIIGISSRASANVLQVSYNDMVKTGTNVDQLFTYFVSSGSPQNFQEDEIVRSGINNSAIAYIHSANSTAFKVVRATGLFYAGNTVVGEDSGTTVVLDSGSTYKYEGDFVRGSGDIIYIENIEPISRSNTQSETIKLILEF